jgi:3-dehydroquinate synthase
MNEPVAKIETSGFTTLIYMHDFSENPRMNAELIVCDANTLRYAQGSDSVLSLDPGEEFKNWDSIRKILDKAFSGNLARDNTVAGLGGGVICDMTAFAASLYLRGCRLVLSPTSLLAMVDASIGGKTGIDWNGQKNMVGTFYPAHEIHIYPKVLETLDRKEFFCGLGEVIKHAMLDGGPQWDFLVSNMDGICGRDPEILRSLILSNVRFKTDVVNRDLRESGLRAHLNLGHTFGHALESATGFSEFSHGEAVVWGLVCAEVRSLADKLGYRLHSGVSDQAKILEAMKADKKRRQGKVRFILQEDRGKTLIREVEDAVVLQVLSAMA